VNILVIGGLGNIGKPITHQLVNMGHTVYVLGRKQRAQTSASFHYICNDTQDIDFLASLQKQYNIDIVVNLAIQSIEQAKANIAAFTNTIKQFIFISTVTVLDREKSVVLTEASACGNPYSTYAQTKRACEELFLEANRTASFPVTIVRPSQTYSNDKFPLSVKGKSYWSVIDRILNNKPVIIHGDGTSIWVSMHSDDFCHAFIPLINNIETLGEIYHITGDELLSWNMIYHELAQQLDRMLNIVHIPTDLLEKSQQYDFRMAIKGDKQYSVIFDNQKLKRLVPDFECHIPIKEGISLYLAYMDKHPELKIVDRDFDLWCDNVIHHGVIA
jgi:nucleoside-diphosphate-sugar epimerase